MKNTLTKLTITEAGKGLRAKEFSSVELTEAVLLEAKAQNGEINAYREIFDDAIELAKNADIRLSNGTDTPLTGIPIAIKDNMLYKGKSSTSVSKILVGHVATYNGTAVEKLLASGGVIVGCTNMDEFAMGSSTERCAWGVVKNPLDITRVPGGSSGGSAAAVAMNGALGSYGSDTGGSIRQPAAFCGLVGLKPTYGAVSRSGLMSLASSFDQIGPFGRTVADAKLLHQMVEGYDKMDSTTIPLGHALRAPATKKEKLTIGVPESLIAVDGIDEDVRKNFRETLDKLKAQGHVIKNIDVPMLKNALAVYYIIMPAEASANLARFDGIRYGFSKEAEKLLQVYLTSRGEGFGKEVRRRILLGTYVLSAGYYDAYYNKAVMVRQMIKDELNETFRDVDVIATPTTPSPAWKIGEKTSDPLKMYIEDIFTVSANIAGIPAISVPSGTVMREGALLPVGIQFMAKAFQEETLFSIGEKVEQNI